MTKMHLSFQFADFFRDRRDELSEIRPQVETPTFLVQTGVVGGLKIKDLKETLLNDQNARIEVALEGFMKTQLDTSIDNRSEFRVIAEKKILSMTQALPLQSPTHNEPTNERHYPFNFNIESWVRHDQENSAIRRAMASRNHFASIPPSLWHEIHDTPKGVPKPRAGARVTYRLTARLLKDHRIIDRIIQPILLLVSQTPSPPMCITDFTGEYRTVQKSILRSSLLKKAGEVTVIVEEPQQLTVRANSDDSVVELPVRLRLERPKQDASLGQSFHVKAEVKWQFRFSTFVSMLEQVGPPTMKQALSSPATAFVRSTLRTRTLNMIWRDWKVVENNSDDNTKTVESQQSLWLRLPHTEVLTPTFWSRFLSRRYSILLQVKITHPGNAKIEVEVPIQVGIEAESPAPYEQTLMAGHRSIDEMIFEDAEGDELLPQYGDWY